MEVLGRKMLHNFIAPNLKTTKTKSLVISLDGTKILQINVISAFLKQNIIY